MNDLDKLAKDSDLVVGFLDLSNSNEVVPVAYGAFNVIIEAFWVNYPYCWVSDFPAESTCAPSTFNLACAYPLRNYPIAPSSSTTCSDLNFKQCNSWGKSGCGGNCIPIQNDSNIRDWKTAFPILPNQTTPVVAFVRDPDSVTFKKDIYDAYDPANPKTDQLVNFFNSFHTSNPHNTKSFLKTPGVLKLAGIGGWGMGGSSKNKPIQPGALGYYNNWAICLQNKAMFVDTLVNIVELGYDGLDIDCETIFAGFKDDLTNPNCANGDASGCYRTIPSFDPQITVNDLVYIVQQFRLQKSDKIISLTPRVEDLIYFDAEDSTNPQLGFFGQILQQLNDLGIVVDLLNIQFYNTSPEYSVTRTSVGKFVLPILTYARKNWNIKYIQVGIVGRYKTDVCDALDSQSCLSSTEANAMYKQLKKQVKINGICLWGINKIGGYNTPAVSQYSDLDSAPISDRNWLNFGFNTSTIIILAVAGIVIFAIIVVYIVRFLKRRK